MGSDPPPGPTSVVPTIRARRVPDLDVVDAPPVSQGAPLNVLVYLLDDVGIESFALYDDVNGWDGAFPYASMPCLAQLAADGCRFRRFWSQVVSTQTRATLLTGLRSIKHRMGVITEEKAAWVLADVASRRNFSSLPAGGSGVRGAARTWCVGKWHVARSILERDSPRVDGGFDWYFGHVTNVGHPRQMAGGTRGWRRFEVSEIDAASGQSTVTAFQPGDDRHLAVEEYLAARSWLQAHAAEEPWVFYVPTHLVHFPYEPGDSWIDPARWSDPNGGHPGATGGAYHTRGAETRDLEWIDQVAMFLESADTMLKGLLDAIPPAVLARTVVVVASDNGSPPFLFQPAHSPSMAALNASGNYAVGKAKSSIYQQGVACPLVIWGGAETGVGVGICDSPVEAADLYATVAEALGALGAVDPRIDGVSLWPLLRAQAAHVREYQETSGFVPLGARPSESSQWGRALARRDGWKLHDVKRSSGAATRELYDLVSDPFERVDRMGDLLSDPTAAAAHDDLSAELARIVAEAEAFEP